MFTKLSQFNDIKTETFINEYFRMVKTLYLIKAQIQQTWVKNYKTEDIINLYQDDVIFYRRQMEVQ